MYAFCQTLLGKDIAIAMEHPVNEKRTEKQRINFINTQESILCNPLWFVSMEIVHGQIGLSEWRTAEI